AGAPAETAPARECPNCGRPMLLRKGRFGEFYGCSGYPECKTIVDPKRSGPRDLGMPCPAGCGGELQEKRSRRGMTFYGCSRYPDCSFTTWDRPTEQRCETCGYPMGERTFRGRALGMRCTNESCPTFPQNGKPEESAAKPARKTAPRARARAGSAAAGGAARSPARKGKTR